jgi:ribulose-phosphate 3-epimerase
LVFRREAVPRAVRIAPSILAADFTRLGEQIAEAEAGGGDQIHIDIMDGRFVPNITMGPVAVQAARRATTLPLDVHLMIVEPERQIPAFIEAGANIISVHVETCPHLHRTIQLIREAGASPSVVLNPHTPASAIKEILPFVDMALVMTVNPGFGGQSFIPETLSKIREIRGMIEALGRPVNIQVDGGIDAQTAPQVVAHGANVLVAGTSIFGYADGIRAGIAALRKAVEND